jgi:hypothetical protein
MQTLTSEVLYSSILTESVRQERPSSVAAIAFSGSVGEGGNRASKQPTKADIILEWVHELRRNLGQGPL